MLQLVASRRALVLASVRWERETEREGGGGGGKEGTMLQGVFRSLLDKRMC